MPATDYQGSSSPFAALGRSLLSLRRDHVHTADDGGGSPVESELESFQRHVRDLFQDLATISGDDGGAEFLSLAWLRRLLDAFLLSQEEFRAILLSHSQALSKSPFDRLVAEYFDRAVKALDVLNGVRDGVEQLRRWRGCLEIALPALGAGQLRRARKALTELVLAVEDRDPAGAVLAQRNRSFGRAAAPGLAHGRSHSWSVSRSWSAARQLQAMAAGLAPPRAADVAATSGLAVPVYTMSCVLVFVASVLVAAIPCQDRPTQPHFSAPRGFPWAAAMAGLHDRLLEESKRRDRRGSSSSSSLMKEICEMERCSRALLELIDPAGVPVGGEKETELRQKADELTVVCESLKDNLDLLERQVRDVFHRIVRSRTDSLDFLPQSST